MARRGENIYKRKDGRWEGRYIKGRKKDGTIHFGYIYSHSYQHVRKDLYEKKLIYAEYNFNYNQGHSKKVNTEKWVVSWLLKQKDTVRPNTYLSYQSKINHHILPYFGNKPLHSISTDDIKQWTQLLNQTLKPSSVRIILQVFSMCLNDAVSEEIISKNPTKGITLSCDKTNQVRAFSYEEQKKIEQQIFLTDANFYTYFPIYLALYTGARIGELAGLKWKDIDWQEQYITINRSIQRVKSDDNTTKLVETYPKTVSSQRSIPLSNQTMYWLEKWKLVTNNNSEYVISGRNGASMDPRNLRYHFKHLKEISDVRDLPFHSLRHSFATRCIEINAPITTLSALMGHKSTKMTLDIYTSSFLSEKQKVIESLNTKNVIHCEKRRQA